MLVTKKRLGIGIGLGLLVIALLAGSYGHFKPEAAQTAVAIQHPAAPHIKERVYLPDGKYDILAFKTPETTAISQTTALLDGDGLPYVWSQGKRLYNPAILAARAAMTLNVQYTDTDRIDPSAWIAPQAYRQALENDQAAKLLTATRKYLSERTVQIQGKPYTAQLLMYDYDYTYNGLLRKAPFAGSFGQLSWLRVALCLYKKYPCEETFKQLQAAMAGYAVPPADGGFQHIFPDGGLWFEEIPPDPPTHIFNAQIASLIELQMAINISGLTQFQYLVDKGRQALEARFFALYDAGTYVRYDLNYKLHEQLFRVSSFTGQGEMEAARSPHQVAIASIQTRRETGATDKGYFLDASSGQAFAGACRLSGDWGELKQYEGVKARGTQSYCFSAYGNDRYGLKGNGFFFLEFPMAGQGDPVIEIKYFDNEAGTLSIDMRHPHHGNVYDFFPVAEIKTSGDKQWKTARVKIPLKSFTAYIGPSYNIYHIYLLSLYQKYFNTTIFNKQLEQYAKAYLYDGDRPLGSSFIHYENLMPGHFRLGANNLAPAPYDAARLFNNNLNDNVDSPYGKAAYVAGEFDEPYRLRGLEIDNYAADSHPGKVEIWANEQAGEPLTLRSVIQGDILQQNTLNWRFAQPFTAKEIKMVFSGFKGQDRLVAREIKLFADRDEFYADKMLTEATGSGLADHTATYDRILAVANYIEKNTTLAYSTKELELRNYYGNMQGQCGDKAFMQIKLLEYIDIPAKMVSLHNAVTMGDGHATAEFFLYNKMNYLDTSYAFFAAADDYQLATILNLYKRFNLSDLFACAHVKPEPYVLFGLNDIRANPALIDTNGYFFAYSPTNRKSVIPAEKLGKNANFYVTSAFYKNADPVFYYDGLDVAYIPIRIAEGAPGLAYGEYGPTADAQSSQDMIAEGRIPTWVYYIGLTGNNNASQKYVFPASGKGKTWEIKIIPAYCSSAEFKLSIRGEGIEVLSQPSETAGFSGYRNGDKAFTFVVRQTAEQAAAFVEDEKIDGRYINIDAIQVDAR